MSKDYIPFGDLWEKEMMKLTKSQMVTSLGYALKQKLEYVKLLEQDIEHLEHGLNNIIVRADSHITKCQLNKTDDSDMLAVSKIAQDTLKPKGII